MKRLLSIIIIFVAILAITSYSQAQKGLKIGIVDVEMIVKELPEASDADKQLQDMAQSYRDSLLTLEKVFTERADKYKKQQSTMTVDQQKKEEEGLQKIQIDYQKFQQEKLGQQGELAQSREKLLSPIREKVRTAIKKIAEKEDMTFVLDKASPMLLYAEDKFDITFSVLDLLKRGANK